MKAAIACTFILVYPVISSSSLDSYKPGCRVPEDYCGPGWIGNSGAFPAFLPFQILKTEWEVSSGDTQLRCLVPLGWVCYENVTTGMYILS